MLCGWPEDGTNWLEKLLNAGCKKNDKNSIIIDEAQLSYWNDSFYNGFLKNINSSTPDRIILFTSYGNPDNSVPVRGTNMWVPDRWRVSLRRVDHQDKIDPVGLLLTKEEFDDMVNKLLTTHQFSQELLDYIFNTIVGYAGAVEDLLRIVAHHDVSFFWHQVDHSLKYTPSHTVHLKEPMRNTRWTRFGAASLSTVSGLISMRRPYSVGAFLWFLN
jgi:hypothetical protein